ncbi:peptidyl-tRNA hydrolase [Actinomadura gamaensis]|uniref:peptidyl-tRNA hydrolase n=1 Tax=Actinomadura gamaensis TaxID=1763541 RepID=A0ABV9TSY2_9ACTN
MRPDYDPLDDPPWAMQLVVRVEKADPPTHDAVCAAAATAVVRLLSDPRAHEPEGEWHACVQGWESRRIRKVARRARGVRWPEVQEIPGITAAAYGAEVRAFPPAPMDEVPPQIAKLQVAGLDLPLADDPLPPPDGPHAEIALNPDVTMTTGKAAAQCGHAAHLLFRQAGARAREKWLENGLRVHLARDVPWRKCVDRATVAVRDGGFTEVPPGTMTAIAWIAD